MQEWELQQYVQQQQHDPFSLLTVYPLAASI